MFGIAHYIDDNSKSDYTIDSILITSGSIINLEKSIRIGNFDENLFIDHVDTDYCIRLLNNNLKTIKFNNILLNHNEGDSIKTRTFFLKLDTRMTHAPKRIYYKTRNYIYLRKKHKYFSKFIPLRHALNDIKNNLFYNKEKLKTIYYLIKGIIDSFKMIKQKLN